MEDEYLFNSGSHAHTDQTPLDTEPMKSVLRPLPTDAVQDGISIPVGRLPCITTRRHDGRKTDEQRHGVSVFPAQLI